MSSKNVTSVITDLCTFMKSILNSFIECFLHNVATMAIVIETQNMVQILLNVRKSH